MASPTQDLFNVNGMSPQQDDQFDLDTDMPDALPPFDDSQLMEGTDNADLDNQSDMSDRQSEEDDADDMKDSDQKSPTEDQGDSDQDSDNEMDDQAPDQISDHDLDDGKNSSQDGTHGIDIEVDIDNDHDDHDSSGDEEGSHGSGDEGDLSTQTGPHSRAVPIGGALSLSNGDTSRATEAPTHDNTDSASQTRLPSASGATNALPTPVSEPILFRENATIQARVASSFDIVPSVALPYLTQCHAIAFTNGPKWILTGGEDGFIRKYDFIASMAGKSPLTMAQRHNMVDSITKAGVIVSYWENEQPLTRTQLLQQNPKITPADFTSGLASYEPKTSTVYALAAHRHGNWCLSGLLSGGVSLYSMRHNEGAIQHYFMHGSKIDNSRGHNSAVSLLVLNADQDQFLSGSWDSTIRNWDLNSGKLVTTYAPSSGQISNIQYRPTGLRDLELDVSGSMPASASEQKAKDNADDDEVDSLFGDSDDDDDANTISVKPQATEPLDTPHSYTNDNVFMSTSIDGTVSVWDVRLQDPVLKLGVPAGVPPWCMSSTWSNDGNNIYVGRRNSTVEEISIRKPHTHCNEKGLYAPNIVKTLQFPKISGPVSAIATMPNSDFLLCGSNDNIRLYNLQLHDNVGSASSTAKKQATPFLIIPGHQGGILSVLHVDETGRFMVSASGNRGWKHASYTDSVLIYEIDFKG